MKAYAIVAIILCLTVGMVSKLPLRQTQGLMRSIAGLMRLEISIPEFSTLSRRGKGLRRQTQTGTKRAGLINLVVDSTGLKVFGEGEWLQAKHKTKAKRKQWHKLHIGLTPQPVKLFARN